MKRKPKRIGEDQSSVHIGGTHSWPGYEVAFMEGSSSSTAGNSNTGLVVLPRLSQPGVPPLRLPATLRRLPTLPPPDALRSSSRARARAMSRSWRSRSDSAR